MNSTLARQANIRIPYTELPGLTVGPAGAPPLSPSTWTSIPGLTVATAADNETITRWSSRARSGTTPV